MSFTLSHVIQGARKAPELLSSETAAYIVLSVAEQVMGAPREVTADSVILHASGSLVVADVPQCSAQVCDECLRELLTALLESVPAATIHDAMRHVAAGEAKGPVALRTELHAALVPLNRSAARRALTRLHRRLNALFADSVLTLREPGTPLARRNRRRGNLEPLRTATAVAAPLPTRTTPEVQQPASVNLVSSVSEEPHAVWHPAQTTHWQFHEASPAQNEGTPIFGSLAVQERITAEATLLSVSPASDTGSGDLWQPSRDERTEAESPVARRHQTELPPPATLEPQVPLEHDTQIEHPVVAKVGLPSSILRRSSSRRSRVADLVQHFAAVHNQPPERAAAELYQMATHAEGEFGALGTATPPPVARESLLPPSSPVKNKPRRIVLKAALALAPVVAFWLMRPPSAQQEVPVPAASPANVECAATVRVSVPERARVFLNDQQERQEQAGPLAVFQKVPCAGQAEVTVRIPEASGSPLPDAWVRVPLPEAELVRAAAQGRPLELAPLRP